MVENNNSKMVNVTKTEMCSLLHNFFIHGKAYSYSWAWGCMGFIQHPVDIMSIFYIKEEFPSINATCECVIDEILPHHPYNNLLHEGF